MRLVVTSDTITKLFEVEFVIITTTIRALVSLGRELACTSFSWFRLLGCRLSTKRDWIEGVPALQCCCVNNTSETVVELLLLLGLWSILTVPFE